MSKYNVWIERVSPYKCVFGARIEVESQEELRELQQFIRAGVEAFEDWKAEKDGRFR